MPSQSPPLTYRSPYPVPGRNVPPVDQPKPPVVNGAMVSAALVCAFVLVGGIVAWIATHPNPLPATAAPVEPMPRLAASRPVRADIIPAVLPAKPREVRVDRAALPTPPPQPQLVRVAETSPPPQSAPPKTETYGTSVQFLGNPAQAAETARREGKLLFVLHVSGNFEDSCFT